MMKFYCFAGQEEEATKEKISKVKITSKTKI